MHSVKLSRKLLPVVLETQGHQAGDRNQIHQHPVPGSIKTFKRESDICRVNSLTLPASSNSNCSVNALCRMQRPVINNFRVFLLSLKKLTINKKWDVGELHWHCIVMPFIVTNLKILQFKVTKHSDFFLHDTESWLSLWPVLMRSCFRRKTKV